MAELSRMPNYGGIGGGGGGGGAVTSVFGRTGAVVAQAGDYGNAQSVATVDGTNNVPAAELAYAVQSVNPGVNTEIGGTANAPIVNAVQDDLAVPNPYWLQSVPRENAGSLAGNVLTSGLISFFKILVVAGQVLTQIAFDSGSTATVTPTHQWFALYDANLNALAATVDNTNVAWGATTLRNLAIGWLYSAGAWGAGTQYTFATSGLFYIGIMVAAATVPTLAAAASNSVASQIAPVLSGNDTAHAAQTTPQLSPAQLTNAGSAGGFFPSFYCG